MVDRLFLAVSLGCLRFVIIEFPDHTHLLFSMLQLVSVVKEAGLNLTWFAIPMSHFRMVLLNFKSVILRTAMTQW